MDIRQEKKEDVVVCYLTGEINADTAGLLSDVSKELISEEVKNVIMNFTGVNYIDSMGMVALIRVTKVFDKIGGRMVISDVQSKVGSILKITKLDTALGIFSSEKEALKDLKK